MAPSSRTASLRPDLLIGPIAGPRRPAMRALPAFALGALAPLAIIAAGALFPPGPWYDALLKPAFTPPDALFGPVWTALYVANAVALGLLLRAPRSVARTNALGAMALQLGLNASWTPVFFGAQSVGGGLLVVVALLAAILACVAWLRRVNGWAALLMLPYLAWVAFAALLNLSIWMLNR